MNSYEFTTSAHGKCLLAGEHAVLSGCPAIILPVREKKIDLVFSSYETKREENPPEASFATPSENCLYNIFQKSLEQALISLNRVFPEDIQGSFKLKNSIEIGAGIGFSAALCVVISRWLVWRGWVKEKEIFDFARNLENFHHGQSSGVDIVGAMSDHIIHFQAAQDTYKIEARWHPKLYISYSGLKRGTKEAITHVSQLRKQNPAKMTLIEDNMKTSVWEIEESLKQEERLGKPLLIRGMERAGRCFEEWGLINPKLQEHLDLLNQLGALVAKPTGAGFGGYVISLWENAPPQHEKIEWLAL